MQSCRQSKEAPVSYRCGAAGSIGRNRLLRNRLFNNTKTGTLRFAAGRRHPILQTDSGNISKTINDTVLTFNYHFAAEDFRFFLLPVEQGQNKKQSTRPDGKADNVHDSPGSRVLRVTQTLHLYPVFSHTYFYRTWGFSFAALPKTQIFLPTASTVQTGCSFLPAAGLIPLSGEVASNQFYCRCLSAPGPS